MTLSTPASARRSICASVRMPSETATVSGSSRFDPHDRLANALQQLARRTAHGDDDAELAGAAGVRLARRFDELLDAREPLRLDVGRVARALRAEVAILRAAASLGVVEHLDGDAVAAVARTDIVGQREQLRNVLGRAASPVGSAALRARAARARAVRCAPRSIVGWAMSAFLVHQRVEKLCTGLDRFGLVRRTRQNPENVHLLPATRASRRRDTPRSVGSQRSTSTAPATGSANLPAEVERQQRVIQAAEPQADRENRLQACARAATSPRCSLRVERRQDAARALDDERAVERTDRIGQRPGGERLARPAPALPTMDRPAFRSARFR